MDENYEIPMPQPADSVDPGNIQEKGEPLPTTL